MDHHGILPNDLLKRIKYSQKNNILYSIPLFSKSNGDIDVQRAKKRNIKNM